MFQNSKKAPAFFLYTFCHHVLGHTKTFFLSTVFCFNSVGGIRRPLKYFLRHTSFLELSVFPPSPPSVHRPAVFFIEQLNNYYIVQRRFYRDNYYEILVVYFSLNKYKYFFYFFIFFVVTTQ